MSVQSQSQRLEGDDLARAQRQQKFTLKEAAIYWAEYLTILPKDAAAIARFRKIFAMLEAAAKSGALQGVTPKQKTKTMNVGGFDTRWDERRTVSTTVPVWEAAVVTREALVKYAESENEEPAFLFPSRKPASSAEDVFTERKAPALAVMMAALIKKTYGKDALEEIAKPRSNKTGAIIRDLQNNGCSLDEKTIRERLKELANQK